MERDSLDAALHSLADEYRREVVATLLDGDRATIEPNADEKLVKLVHNHLPKLADAGFLEYSHNEDRLEIERGSNWDEIEPLAEYVIEEFSKNKV